MSEDWAETRAYRWWIGFYGGDEVFPYDKRGIASLAALLREVREEYAKSGFCELQRQERAALLAEVRRVVEGLRKECAPEHAYPDINACWACDEILSRLEKL